MNRKDFLITLWKNGMQPILMIGGVFICLNFLYHVFTESGTERFLTLFVVGVGLLILVIQLLSQLFHSWLESVSATFPDSIKFWLNIIRKTIDYLLPTVLGMVIYRTWMEDREAVAIVLAVLLLNRIRDII